jgi:glycerol-3-phosphate dehydrogenase
MAIAVQVMGHVEEALARAGVSLGAPEPLAPLRMPMLGEAFVRPYQDGERVAADGEYGRIVCHCERVSRGEVRDAFASTIPPTTLDGLRRRTRVLMGRCQGFYCGAQVRALLEQAQS